MACPFHSAVTFQVEPFNRKELWPLMRENWFDKNGQGEPNVDWAMYQQMQNLQVIAMRAAGKLVGYAFVITSIFPYKIDELTSFIQQYYIQKPYRGYFRSLLKEIIKVSKGTIYITTQLDKDCGKVLEKSGFLPTERIHRRAA